MLTEFQRFDDKVVALDDKKGLVNYLYQDNIEEILKQQNVVEEIDNTINKLNNEKDYIEVNKSNFDLMLFHKDYGEKGLVFIFIAVIIAFIGYLLGLGWWGKFIRLVSIPVMLTAFPTIAFQYKKFKNDMELSLININEQIKEFTEKLAKEKDLLISLKNDMKANNNDIKCEKNVIDNTKNNRLINIQKEKFLYETYRKWCYKFQKNKESKLLEDSEISNDDLKIMKEMSDRAVKVLSKKKD